MTELSEKVVVACMKWADVEQLFLQINYSTDSSDMVTCFAFYRTSVISQNNSLALITLDPNNNKIKKIVGSSSFINYIQCSLSS